MSRFTNLVLAHRRWVVLAWVVLAVAGGALAATTVDRLGYDFSTPGRPGYETNEAIAEEFGNGGATDPLLIVVTVPDTTTVIKQRKALTALYGQLAQPGWRVATPFDEGRGARRLIGRDGRTAVALVYPPTVPGPDPYAAALPQLEQQVARQSVAGAPVRITGAQLLAENGGEERPVAVEIALGAGAALIILALVFGSFLALIPLVTAAVAITTTFLLVLGLTAVTEISFIVQYLIGLIGLGVAIDYSLLIVMRWRQERANGADEVSAVRIAMSTAGRSVLFSGVTVAISLAALVVLPVPFLRSVGIGGLLIPLVSVMVALTLLPVLLLTLGPRLEWPRRQAPRTESALWHRVGQGVLRFRWASILVSVGVLLVLASPVLGMRLGAPESAAVADGTSAPAVAFRQAVEAGIPPGVTRPVEVLARDTTSAVTKMAAVEGVSAVLAPAGPAWKADGDELMSVVLTQDASTEQARRSLDRVRDTARTQLRVTRVGGSAAAEVDAVEAIYGQAWWILLMIVAITFALLAYAVRSVWLPVKALVLNGVSIAAAYGITVWIWQEGHLTQTLFGVSATGSLTYWVPIAAFSFLFGLSMDYEVFILSRIREERDGGQDTDTAVVTGLAHTGQLVTCAALILFFAFVALSTVPVVDVKIFATTLALGILLDATVVRGVLTPALVGAMGQANWWWPGRPRHQEATVLDARSEQELIGSGPAQDSDAGAR
ncbi:MMPL family transporter [Kineosporia mesophila]|uniref:MMPL family transporter n=1 Tax=Kineosporia mesophila TaxID=566012 RepID=A0ABP7ACM7_9ACTN|nr:MMPL family transporter [Kineosporia mesophila]MCD5351216.1 MMPL family transporter [Kineosporia mesophila]